MAIDGIGQSKGTTVAGLESAAAHSSEDENFELLPESVARSERPAFLEQCRSGAVSVEQYLDARMADAMRHLENKLTPETFGSVREVLRDQVSSGDDPVVAGLLRRATGKSLEA